MIRVLSMKMNDNTKSATVSLFSDTKSEVTDSTKIVGLPANVTIEQGSNIITASGEVAFMKSDGTWNWLG